MLVGHGESQQADQMIILTNANEKLHFWQQARIQYATSSLTKYTY